MPRAARPLRSAASSRTVSSRRAHRYPVSSAAVVVDEREQDRLAAADGRAVQRVAGPALVRRVGLEPAERLRRQPVRPGVQLQAHEVALQRPFVR